MKRPAAPLTHAPDYRAPDTNQPTVEGGEGQPGAQAPHQPATSPTPRAGICSRCHEGAVFDQDEAGDWLSECCGAPEIPEDVPAWAEEA